MKNFNEILMYLPDANHIKEIKIFDEDGRESDSISNKPGSHGSIKLYNHLFILFGELNTIAALKGLDLFCEHVEDAKASPGKHPNIDRLLDIVKTKKTFKMQVI